MSEVSQLINGDYLRQYRPAQYIVFVSDPGSVQKWRAAENTTGVRDRLLETTDGIHNHQMRLLQVADKFSAESGAGMAVVYNRQNPQATEQNIAFLRDIASNVFSEK
jgi:adenylate kinase